jgi:hypothetical protein
MNKIFDKTDKTNKIACRMKLETVTVAPSMMMLTIIFLI